MPPENELARRLRELEWLHAGLRAVTSTLDLAELLRAVLAAIKSIVSAEALSLLLLDRERDELVFAASETLREETLVGPSPSGPGREPGLEDRRLAVALRRDGRRFGLLELAERWDGRPFDEADRIHAEAVAVELANSLDAAAIAHDADALHAAFACIDDAVPSHA